MPSYSLPPNSVFVGEIMKPSLWASFCKMKGLGCKIYGTSSHSEDFVVSPFISEQSLEPFARSPDQVRQQPQGETPPL